jgi:hypothetical protein
MGISIQGCCGGIMEMGWRDGGEWGTENGDWRLEIGDWRLERGGALTANAGGFLANVIPGIDVLLV